MKLPSCRLPLLFLASLLCMGQLCATAQPAQPKPVQPKPAQPKPVPKKKDPVQMAFALPKGMVLTPKEMEWANRVRAQLEPQLRDAIHRVQNSTDQSEKLKAAKEARKIKQQIRAAIYTIIQARMAAAAKEAAKRRAAMIKAAQKRQAQNRKRRNHKPRRR